MIKAVSPLLFCLLVAPGASAQEEEKEKEKEKVSAQEANAKKATPLQKLLAAAPEDREKELIAFLEDQIASGAIYSGQYDGLAPIAEPATALLHEWAIDAPLQVVDADAFRRACIHALRDLCGKEAPDDVTATMKEIAKDEFESRTVKQAAVFALAQFGDRSLVDAMIKNAEAATKSDDPRRQAAGYSALAQIHYNIRDYDAAVKAYESLLALHEEDKINLGRDTAVTYYNCACSLALSGQTDKAFEYVSKALEIDSGRRLSRRLLETDMDIKSLREDPRFAEIVEEHFDGGGTRSRKSEQADKKDAAAKTGSGK